MNLTKIDEFVERLDKSFDEYKKEIAYEIADIIINEKEVEDIILYEKRSSKGITSVNLNSKTIDDDLIIKIEVLIESNSEDYFMIVNYEKIKIIKI